MNSLVAVKRLRIGSKSKLKLVPMVKPPRVGHGARRLNFFDPEVSIGNCFHVGVHINKKLREKRENNFRKKFSFRVSLSKIRCLMLLANVERAEFNVKLACSGVLENYGEREFEKRSFRCIIYRRLSGIKFIQKASCKPALAGLSALFNIYKAAPWPTPLARRERNSIILVRLSGLKKKLESADITESPGTICK